MAFLPYLHKLINGYDLTPEDAEVAAGLMFEGHATTAQIASFLAVQASRPLAADTLVGYIRAMRKAMVPVRVRLDDGEVLVDTCGTGGDGAGTFNISTAAALVAAGAGLRVAKHGNRSISSQCGSADVLEALGAPIYTDPAQMAAAIEEFGFSFLFAQVLHPGMRHVGPARQELKHRTVFNILGPLSNPASAQVQLIGAPSEGTARTMAEALALLGGQRALVVSGAGGLDEISTVGETVLFQVSGTAVDRFVWTPEQFGIRRVSLREIAGCDASSNAALIRAILEGSARGAERDIVVLNAAAAIWLAQGGSMQQAIEKTAAAIDSGAALQVLDSLAASRV